MSKSTISSIIYGVGVVGVWYVTIPFVELFGRDFWILVVSMTVIVNAKTWSGEYIKRDDE